MFEWSARAGVKKASQEPRGKDKTGDPYYGEIYIELVLKAMEANELVWGEARRTEKRTGPASGPMLIEKGKEGREEEEN